MADETEIVDALVEQSMALMEAMSKLLAGKPAGSQGAALADLLARWVAGHYLGGQVLMDEVLASHIAHVRQMAPWHVERLKREEAARHGG
jgi:hypothetical protein